MLFFVSHFASVVLPLHHQTTGDFQSTRKPNQLCSGNHMHTLTGTGKTRNKLQLRVVGWLLHPPGRCPETPDIVRVWRRKSAVARAIERESATQSAATQQCAAPCHNASEGTCCWEGKKTMGGVPNPVVQQQQQKTAWKDTRIALLCVLTGALIGCWWAQLGRSIFLRPLGKTGWEMLRLEHKITKNRFEISHPRSLHEPIICLTEPMLGEVLLCPLSDATRAAR